MKLMKDRWNYVKNNYGFEYEAVHVNEDGYVDRAMKKDHNGYWVPAAVYAPCKTGGYDNIMPCTRRDFRRKGVIM